MKKRTINPKIKYKREEENIAKFKEEIEKIKAIIQKKFPTAETIAIDPEFKELSFYTDLVTFDNSQKNIKTPEINLNYIKSDKDSISLYFKYSI